MVRDTREISLAPTSAQTDAGGSERFIHPPVLLLPDPSLLFNLQSPISHLPSTFSHHLRVTFFTQHPYNRYTRNERGEQQFSSTTIAPLNEGVMKTTAGIVTSILLAATLALTGCSPTGWASKPMPDASQYEPGQQITVLQKDGTETNGAYVGNTDLEQTAYATSYNEAILHKGLDVLLPVIGEQVQITTRLAENRIISGRLVGFDEVNLWLQSAGQAGPEKVYVASITGFSHGAGHYLGQKEFRNLFLDGSIPLRTAVVVNRDGADVQIPISNIAAVHEGRITGGASTTVATIAE